MGRAGTVEEGGGREEDEGKRKVGERREERAEARVGKRKGGRRGEAIGERENGKGERWKERKEHPCSQTCSDGRGGKRGETCAMILFSFSPVMVVFGLVRWRETAR